jgi:hypothetical protein
MELVLAQSKDLDPMTPPGPYSFAVVANMKVLKDQSGFFFDMLNAVGGMTTQVGKWPDYDLF